MARKRYKTKQRKTRKKNKKGGEYSELAKNTMKKNASRYPKQFYATVEQTNPAELIKKKRTPKVYPRKGPGIGGKRKTKKRKTKRRKRKHKRKTRKFKQHGGQLHDRLKNMLLPKRTFTDDELFKNNHQANTKFREYYNFYMEGWEIHIIIIYMSNKVNQELIEKILYGDYFKLS